MTDLLNKFRSFMQKEGIDFFLVSSTDDYLNEYIDLKQNARYLITGFSGSTGDALVTKDKIFLFVDGRYHIQADKEVNSNIVTVVKVELNQSIRTAIINKIYELANTGSILGIVSKKISYFSYKALKESLQAKNIKIKEFDYDPVLKNAEIVSLNNSQPLRFIDVHISGINPDSKLDLIQADMKQSKIDVMLITQLEEIAYLTNLRGKNIPFSSSFKAKAVIGSNKCKIYTDLNKLTDCIGSKYSDRFEFLDINSFDNYISNIGDKVIGYVPSSINLYDYRLIENNKTVSLEFSTISKLKSVKNEAELFHMKECFKKSDIVISRAITWLNQNLEKGLKVSEKDFSDKVKQMFFEEGAYGLSFEVLASSGTNTAIIHYTNPDPDKYIQKGEFVLLDCGAYFEGGYATDTTRTFLAKGKETIADKEKKKIYTTVLKAFLHGLNYSLNLITSGFDIDQNVREIVNIGDEFTFPHGTGHGVGISVHETPPRISPAEESKKPLLSGMCFSIEPGLYKINWGGIRLENTVFIESIDNKPVIKTLTRSKFDDNLIDYGLLDEQELQWLDDYQNHSIG